MESLERWAIDIVLVLVGAGMIALGSYLWIVQQPIEGGVLTTGKIVAHVTETDSDNDESKSPVIEFRDRYERIQRFQNEIGGSGAGIEGEVGQVVKVRYDPADPSRAQWADQPGRWIPPTVVSLGAILWLIELGLVAWRTLRRLATRQGEPEPSGSL